MSGECFGCGATAGECFCRSESGGDRRVSAAAKDGACDSAPPAPLPSLSTEERAEAMALARKILERLRKTTSGEMVSFDVLHATEVIEAERDTLKAERDALRAQVELARAGELVGLKAAESEAATLKAERDEAREQLQALNDFLETCLCGECGGSGRIDNHVTGEVECDGCEGTGHDSRKAFAHLATLQGALKAKAGQWRAKTNLASQVHADEIECLLGNTGQADSQGPPMPRGED
jgi:hypothetical protein